MWVECRGALAAMSDRFHILIVEDEPLALDMLQAMLNSEYHVQCAATGAEAYACLSKSHIDLMLVDWQLPDCRGDVLAEHAENSGIATILMSGDPAAIDALKDRHRPYLAKPFRAARVLEAVRSALNRP
jgi:DNA-binding response OmpR family regulator